MRNSKRDRIWDAMSREEKLNYLATTKDKGNKRYAVLYSYNYELSFNGPDADWISASLLN